MTARAQRVHVVRWRCRFVKGLVRALVADEASGGRANLAAAEAARSNSDENKDADANRESDDESQVVANPSEDFVGGGVPRLRVAAHLDKVRVLFCGIVGSGEQLDVWVCDLIKLALDEVAKVDVYVCVAYCGGVSRACNIVGKYYSRKAIPRIMS